MKIEDVKIGTKVKLISIELTDEYLGYDSTHMLGIGSVSEVLRVESIGTVCKYVQLSDGFWYAVDDLELHEVPNEVLSKLTVNISLEDKNEIAKDILKIVLKDLNVIISDAIESLAPDNLVGGEQEVKQPVDVQTAASNIDFSDEKLQSMFEEVMKDVMKDYLRDSINTLNKTAFGI